MNIGNYVIILPIEYSCIHYIIIFAGSQHFSKVFGGYHVKNKTKALKKEPENNQSMTKNRIQNPSKILQFHRC